MATRRLRERGEREARDLDETLRRQRERIVEELDRHEGQYKQITLAFDEEERRQLQSNMRYWRTRLDQFDRDLEQEPGRSRAFYQVQARRVEPVGLVYLWPETNLKGFRPAGRARAVERHRYRTALSDESVHALSRFAPRRLVAGSEDDCSSPEGPREARAGSLSALRACGRAARGLRGTRRVHVPLPAAIRRHRQQRPAVGFRECQREGVRQATIQDGIVRTRWREPPRRC